jgi:hypothetical protein
MLQLTISCIIHVKTRFLDRATYQESIAENSNSLARSVAELYAFEVLLVFMTTSPVLCHISQCHFYVITCHQLLCHFPCHCDNCTS